MRGPLRGRNAAVLAFVLAGLLTGAASTALAGAASPGADRVTFDEPSAAALLGEPLVFRTALRSDVAPRRVELITIPPRGGAASVEVASLEDRGGGAFEASVQETGHAVPNTSLRYRFRAVMPDGTAVLGPEAMATVVDPRFEWRTLEGAIIRLHWYEGDEAFARRALEIGEGAIKRASELLGVTETEPLDFFIYASEPAMRAALGPGTRENVGGQANASLRTMFGLIEPSEIGSEWVDVLVEHELTHLVFDTAVRNAYNAPPRWLNEGVAVYLSEGYGASDGGLVRTAAERGTVIPLEGLGGLFPTTRDRFNLAYAESVSAVSFFIETYGEERLVSLIRSYGGGVTDDQAFTTATGVDLAAFDDSWLSSLGAQVPDPFGPQPAPPGPLPPGWTGASDPVVAPTRSSAPSAPAPGDPSPGGATSAPAPHAPSQGAGGDSMDGTLLLAAGAVGAVLVGIIIVGAVVIARRRREA
ncbi:MAG: peptidase MA family metallohydrolase [Chloroflexota bacterium]|nr:peptidase MA family metallohydrolase [Chloroflexota bacterium]